MSSPATGYTRTGLVVDDTYAGRRKRIGPGSDDPKVSSSTTEGADAMSSSEHANSELQENHLSPPVGPLSMIPFSPAAEQEFEALCRDLGDLTEDQRRELAAEVKIDHLYSGLYVVCKRTHDDVVVIAAGDESDQALATALAMMDNEDPKTQGCEAFNVPQLEARA